MLGWARRASEHLEGDLLELYCGNGNFTVALADRFRCISPVPSLIDSLVHKIVVAQD